MVLARAEKYPSIMGTITGNTTRSKGVAEIKLSVAKITLETKKGTLSVFQLSQGFRGLILKTVRKLKQFYSLFKTAC